MPEVKHCPKCKGIMYHNQGISKKTGKPFENWKCKCGNIEWINVRQKGEMEGTQKVIKEMEETESIERALKLMNDNMISGFEVINNNIKALIQKLDK